MVNLSVFKGKNILVTGDTGFKGSWLCLWLHILGARVFGYALEPERDEDHFNLLGLNKIINHVTGDIRDWVSVKKIFDLSQPEFLFHLAAQPLVRYSYQEPRITFDTNVLGSVNILEAARLTESLKALIYVTSDKCYRNNEWIWGYRENDTLGGHDPYSASKAAAEVVFSSYQDSFFKIRGRFGAASVRAGNVIGGGDWASDRIVPDTIRALKAGKPIRLRNPESTRPWQHVLEPLSGYLVLAANLYYDPQKFSGAWNFGPRTESIRTVQDLAQAIVNRWGSGEIFIDHDVNAPHEAGLLHLNCDKANQILDWFPRWNFEETVTKTIDWYKNSFFGKNSFNISKNQIIQYMEGRS